MIGKSGDRNYNMWLSSNPIAEAASATAHANPAHSVDPGLCHTGLYWDESRKSFRAWDEEGGVAGSPRDRMIGKSGDRKYKQLAISQNQDRRARSAAKSKVVRSYCWQKN
jgi:hypothetical protein